SPDGQPWPPPDSGALWVMVLAARQALVGIPAHVLRLSGTLCFLDWAIKDDESPEPKRVDEIFMSAACCLVCDYLWPHSRAALRQIGLSERHANSRRVLRWIKVMGWHRSNCAISASVQLWWPPVLMRMALTSRVGLSARRALDSKPGRRK